MEGEGENILIPLFSYSPISFWRFPNQKPGAQPCGCTAESLWGREEGGEGWGVDLEEQATDAQQKEEKPASLKNEWKLKAQKPLGEDCA